MKDKQAPATHALTGLPILSPLLHIVSMPLIVFFRSGFGYSYLRPKAVFLALVWASFLLSFIVWKEPAMHPRYAAPAIFSTLASALYLSHLASSFIKEARSQGEHDQFSGHSHLLRFLGGANTSPATQRKIQLLAEPALAFIAGIACRPSSTLLGLFLCTAAVALFFKEAINAWLTTRRKKLIADKLGEAEDSIEAPAPPTTAPTSSRRPRQPRQNGQLPM